MTSPTRAEILALAQSARISPEAAARCLTIVRRAAAPASDTEYGTWIIPAPFEPADYEEDAR